MRELENFSVYLEENFELYEFECWNWSWTEEERTLILYVSRISIDDNDKADFI